MRTRLFLSALTLWAVVSLLHADTNDHFTITTYNVENWNAIERWGKPDQPKPSWARAAVVNTLTNVRPDVLAIEEMGSTNDLTELHHRLRAKGMDYPYSEWIQAADSARHVALLSRFPITRRFSRTDYTYRLDGQLVPIQRGILDVLIQVNPHYAFRALVVHLKSKRATEQGDQSQMRLEEARLLRAHIDRALRQTPHLNLIAMGDFNDTLDSPPMRALVGPISPLPALDSEGRDNTHYWKKQKEYSRLDYLMVSPGMTNEYVPDSARIADYPGWNKASDHRAVSARFFTRDIGPVPAAPADASPWFISAGWIVNILLLLTILVLVCLFIYTRRKNQ
jgi:endonuclease/exonuclease/phosphatase family metal-dependent hydrolase